MDGRKCKASHLWSFVIFVSTPAYGLCCVWFICPVLGWFCCQKTGTSSVDWAQPSRLLSEDGEREKKTGQWGVMSIKLVIVLLHLCQKVLDFINRCENVKSYTCSIYCYELGL
jgi:hypothetical protein